MKIIIIGAWLALTMQISAIDLKIHLNKPYNEMVRNIESSNDYSINTGSSFNVTSFKGAYQIGYSHYKHARKNLKLKGSIWSKVNQDKMFNYEMKVRLKYYNNKSNKSITDIEKYLLWQQGDTGGFNIIKSNRLGVPVGIFYEIQANMLANMSVKQRHTHLRRVAKTYQKLCKRFHLRHSKSSDLTLNPRQFREILKNKVGIDRFNKIFLKEYDKLKMDLVNTYLQVVKNKFIKFNKKEK